MFQEEQPSSLCSINQQENNLKRFEMESSKLPLNISLLQRMKSPIIEQITTKGSVKQGPLMIHLVFIQIHKDSLEFQDWAIQITTKNFKVALK